MSERRRTARLAAAGIGVGDTPPATAGTLALRERRVFGIRLQALPADLLGPILHSVGRATRLVCRHFHTSYSPLPRGLVIHGDAACKDLLRLIRAQPAPRFPRVHTLACILPGSSRLVPALMASLPHSFPALRSLHVTPDAGFDTGHFKDIMNRMPASTYSSLAPLAANLTHLSFPGMNVSSLDALAATLTSLRSLCLDKELLDSDLQAVSHHLPHLEALHMQDRYQCRSINLAKLKQLSTQLPHLTRLVMEAMAIGVHDPEISAAASTLASSWPHLADFHLNLTGWHSQFGFAAALAQHTALTRLVISAPAFLEWDLLSTLSLRELHVSCLYNLQRQQRWTWVPAQMGTVTKLVLCGRLTLDSEVAGHLALMADSLLSLSLKIPLRQCGRLAHLSCLSKLHDLTLHHQAWRWDTHQAVTEKQAAAGLAVGLSSLRYLHVQSLEQQQLEQQLVQRLAAHRRLQELYITDWDPRWPARLARLASSLARLTMFYGAAADAPSVISSLRGLRQLHYLKLQSKSVDPIGEDSDADGVPATPAALSTSSGLVRGAGGRDQGSHGNSSTAGLLRLPPKLRVLVLEVRQLSERLRAVLQEAARRQGCSIREQAVPAEWDDCGGHADGVSLAWRRRCGRPP